ncbi:mechanosensitive ion channel domain-containing protein [Thiorhodospira sibirica]|uniref:mechanosensitive ion channel domain-containing protein n=1 Tax=Thiorhodospira sibirica TaxID=154347 RepID=UPI000A05F7BD|nr:mechanosensitive ion channel domain-containing protein [Thiorhodospira sibirica]
MKERTLLKRGLISSVAWPFIVALVLLLIMHGNVMAQAEPSIGDIQSIQQQLRDRGYGITLVDGLLGAETIRAMRRFQRDNNLDATGPLDARAMHEIRSILQPTIAPVEFALPLRSHNLEQGYHRLTNQELLDQAIARYQQSRDLFHAEQRLLQQTQVLYQQIKQANTAWQPPPQLEVDIIEDQTVLEHAKQRVESYQRYENELKRELQTLELIIKQNDATLEANTGFINTLRELYAMVLELQLRVADGTLQGSSIPGSLTKQAVQERGQVLQTQRQELINHQESNQQRLQTLKQRIEEIQNISVDAQTRLATIRMQQDEAQKQQKLSTQYQEKTNEELHESLAALEDERMFLQGDFRLLFLRFNRGYAQLTEFESALGVLPALVERPSTGISAAALEEKINALETLMAELEARSELLQQLDQKQQAVVESGEAFSVAASFLQEHLAKMFLLIEISDARQLSRVQGLTTEAIEQARTRVAEAIQGIDARVNDLHSQLTLLQTRREEIRSARTQANQILADLQQTLESTRQAQEWERQLAELDGAALVERFNSDAKALQTLREQLETQAQAVNEFIQEEKIQRDRLYSLSDPLVRMSHPTIQAEQQRIQRRLHELSEPDESAAHAQQNTAGQTATPTEVSSTEGRPSTGERFTDDAEGLRTYQSLVASRQQYLRNQQHEHVQLLATLEALEAAQTDYIQILSQLHRLSLQQYATSTELKKQLGRGNLAPEQAPDGLLRALRREPITALETEITERINQRAHVRLRMAHLKGNDSAPSEEDAEPAQHDLLQSPQYTLFDSLQAIVGQRLELLVDLSMLETERLQIPETLGNSERLEQQAEARMRLGSGLFERLLGLLPSDRAEELTELLRNNYRTLLLVEAQQALLATEKEKVAELIQLVQRDQQSINELLPVLKEQLATLALQQERVWLQVRAQLQPEEAGKLIADFTARTGEQFKAAPPLLEHDKADFIERAKGALLALYAQQMALQEWIMLFEQRQASALLSENERYLDLEGEFRVIASSHQRTLNRLTGHSTEQLAALPERQRPGTHLERAYFLQGEIGVDHEQRTQAHLRALLRFVIELFVIIYLTWFLIVRAKRFVDRKSQEIEMSAAPDSTHKLFALSFAFIAFRVVVLVLAIILVLSRLGFDIGVIIASLGIFGFALAFAAKETLSDLLGGITLFAEHSFSIGDVIQISSGDPKVGATEFGRVDSVSWRSTRITNVMNYSINIPNGRVAESVIINYTRQLPLRDFTHVYVSPAYETRKVILLITEAVDECNLIRQDLQKQILATGNTVVDKLLVGRYEIRWYTDIPYLARARVLTELWTRIWQKFHDAGVPLEYIVQHQNVDRPSKPAQESPQLPSPTHVNPA